MTDLVGLGAKTATGMTGFTNKKNQRRRQLYRDKKKNKSDENETIDTTLDALEADLAKANALADEARQAVIATPPNLASP